MQQERVTGLEEQAERIFRLVDAMDAPAMAAILDEQAQGIDEVSRGWMRGRDCIEAYLEQLHAAVTEVHSEVRDVQAIEWGDTGVVTCTVEQRYVIDGEERRLSLPTSITLRRHGDDWRIAVLHSAPLPDA